MRKYLYRAGRNAPGEQGITGLETAIILIAFVVVATVFAFIVITTGIFSAERGKETVFAGLQKARGTMEIRGGVIVVASAPPTVDSIAFSVATTSGGDPIPMDPAATINRTVIAYRDGTTAVPDVPYTIQVLVGDADNLLENGELFLVNIAASGITGATIGPNTRFTLELQTPVGAVIDLTRSMPGTVDPVTQLH
jgi:flagellin FlaB